jgi:hypothetical protein
MNTNCTFKETSLMASHRGVSLMVKYCINRCRERMRADQKETAWLNECSLSLFRPPCHQQKPPRKIRCHPRSSSISLGLPGFHRATQNMVCNLISKPVDQMIYFMTRDEVLFSDAIYLRASVFEPCSLFKFR